MSYSDHVAVISCRMGKSSPGDVVAFRKLLHGGFLVLPPNSGHLLESYLYQIWTLSMAILEKTVRQRNKYGVIIIITDLKFICFISINLAGRKVDVYVIDTWVKINAILIIIKCPLSDRLPMIIQLFVGELTPIIKIFMVEPSLELTMSIVLPWKVTLMDMEHT